MKPEWISKTLFPILTYIFYERKSKLKGPSYLLWFYNNLEMYISSTKLLLHFQIPLKNIYVVPSYADPGCLSRIPDPDFNPSQISDPGSKNSNKREGWKKLVVIPFL